MARRHGWQFPAHPFQIIATIVFFILTVAYYVFFAAFLGKKLYEYIALGVYSFLAFSVFVLYIRCTGIDPADPELFVEGDNMPDHKSQDSDNASVIINGLFMRNGSGCYNAIGRFLCGWLVVPDCRGDTQQEEEETMFCTLCHSNVRKFSKHCRNCGKCVDEFDHHCRWLNNCVGKKNYISFVCLMAATTFWLLVQSGVGVVVIVRCFVEQKAMEHLITENLGLGFTRIPFAVIVIVCTILSFMALVAFGELFVFHLILIQKGITTYDYIVTLRAQTEAPGSSIDGNSQPPSPTSSVVTAASGRSSLGLSMRYRGASLSCTPPPNIFMDQQDDVIQQHLEPESVRSTVDPDALTQRKPRQRQQVRISPWKLAKIDSKEASQAAAKARASSSYVLYPVNSWNTPHKTRSNASGRSTPGSNRETKSSRKGKAVSESCSHTRDHSGHETPLNEEESSNIVVARGNLPSSDESSVVWDPEAGRFVSSSSQTPAIELVAFGGGSLAANQRLNNNNNNITSSGNDPPPGFIRHVRSHRGSQLPVFTPADFQPAS